jgi:molybdate transport system ATP-binding protein
MTMLQPMRRLAALRISNFNFRCLTTIHGMRTSTVTGPHKKRFSRHHVNVDRRQERNFSSAPEAEATAPSASDYENDTSNVLLANVKPLVTLDQVVLAHPGDDDDTSTPTRQPVSFSIAPPSVKGGHVVLGRNGTGKSLLSNSLISPETHIRQGCGSYSFFDDVNDEDTSTSNASSSKSTRTSWARKRAIAHVSFESHLALLASDTNSDMTAYKAISGGGNQMSKAAQFLVVRFGLFPLLKRSVHTLSTGEIRKVMIVRALAQRPRLLVLDNAFDGLDVAAREHLKDLVSRTIQGFSVDILVQGVSAKDAEHTQVLMLTHRPEEIVDEVEIITYLQPTSTSYCETTHVENSHSQNDIRLVTENRHGRSSEELLERVLGFQRGTSTTSEPWEDSSLPSIAEVKEWWGECKTELVDGANNATSKSTLIIDAQGLTVRKGDATLLQNIDWNVQTGERWLVAGGNGAGKSTLSRLIISNNANKEDDAETEGRLNIAVDQSNIGWCSTELHIRKARAHTCTTQSQSSQTTREVLIGNTHNNTQHDNETIEALAQWLHLDSNILAKPFSKLSQGQQKMALIGAAIASRPKLLVLDEPCQGLDASNRRLVLGLTERLCQAMPELSLIYITHYLEELLPSVKKILHLKDRGVAFSGDREQYNPSKLLK